MCPAYRAGTLKVLGLDDALDLTGLLARLRDGTAEALTETLAAVHYCARPVRLAGSSPTIHVGTGEVLSTFRSADVPLGGAVPAVREPPRAGTPRSGGVS